MDLYNFNPHFRKGSDGGFGFDIILFNISIHTSAREVTIAQSVRDDADADFNPHFRKGSDIILCPRYRGIRNFNPHFRKGSDKISKPQTVYVKNFNPHFRKGSDG